MKPKEFVFASLGLTFVLLLASCQSENSLGVTNVTHSSLFTPSPPLSSTTTTDGVELTSTAILDLTPTATSVRVIEATNLPLSVPTIAAVTWTPLPTLSPDELETVVAELIANPMNCIVPCWWGAIPGVTNLNEIRHTLSPYNFKIDEYADGELTVLRLGIGYVEEQNDFEIRIGYEFSNSLLTAISAYAPPISEFLVKYGQPEEVWLSAMNDPRQWPPLLWFTIIYLQEGVGVGYVVDGDIQNDMLIGCLGDEDTERLRRLRLLEPDTANDFKDFLGTFDEERRYLPLEEATVLTMEDFMQRIVDPTRPQCIETPTELWE